MSKHVESEDTSPKPQGGKREPPSHPSRPFEGTYGYPNHQSGIQSGNLTDQPVAPPGGRVVGQDDEAVKAGTDRKPCRYCKGSGRVGDAVCPMCRGQGTVAIGMA